MDVALSVEGVPIHFPLERWFHIVANHDDLASYYEEILETVESPDIVLRSYGGSFAAMRGYGRKQYLAVIYKQTSANDGFIITAYFTNKINRKKAIWKRQ